MSRPFFAIRRPDGGPTDATCGALGCAEHATNAARGVQLCARCYQRMAEAAHAHGWAAPDWDSVALGCGCGPDPCRDCRAWVLSGARVVVVGERLNMGGRLYRPMNPDNELSYRFLRRLGGLRWGPSRDRLISAGVRWDLAINLLMPDRVGMWEQERARQVAASIIEELLRDFDLVVMLGKRVEDAFAYAMQHDQRRVHRFMGIPHPSGRNRFWNEGPAAVSAVRRAFRIGLLWAGARHRGASRSA